MLLNLPVHIFSHDPEAYLVGGAVRDLIMGNRPLDYDIVTRSPHTYARKVAAATNGHLVAIGPERFRLFRVIGNNLTIDITGMKGDSIESDLGERDFTINALACRLKDRQVIDCADGIADIMRRTVRMVCSDSFQKDPLRLLRAYRLSASLGFQIESETRVAIRLRAPLLQNVAAERIWSELQLILKKDVSHRCLSDMAETGLLNFLFPELAQIHGCPEDRPQGLASDSLACALEAFPLLEDLLALKKGVIPLLAQYIRGLSDEDRIALKMAVLFHETAAIFPEDTVGDIDKTTMHRSIANPDNGSDLLARIFGRLRTSKRIRENVTTLVRHYQEPARLFSVRTPLAEGRFFRECKDAAPRILLLAKALGSASGRPGPSASYQAYIDGLLRTYFLEVRHKLHQPLLLSGDDIGAQFGLKPSPLYGVILRKITEAHLAGIINERGEALEWAAAYLKNVSPSGEIDRRIKNAP